MTGFKTSMTATQTPPRENRSSMTVQV
jgi:hypothetical protein